VIGLTSSMCSCNTGRDVGRGFEVRLITPRATWPRAATPTPGSTILMAVVGRQDFLRKPRCIHQRLRRTRRAAPEAFAPGSDSPARPRASRASPRKLRVVPLLPPRRFRLPCARRSRNSAATKRSRNRVCTREHFVCARKCGSCAAGGRASGSNAAKLRTTRRHLRANGRATARAPAGGARRKGMASKTGE